MRAAIACLVITVLLAVAAILWTPVAVPRLVKLPTDFKTTINLAGTFEAQAAPGSLARLPSPVSLPVSVDVQVVASGGEGDLVVVNTTQTQKVGAPTGPTQNVEFKSQNVLDRRTAQNVDDPRAWSYVPTHPVNRAGAYSFTFGFDFNAAGSFPFWDDSIGASYPLTAGGNAGGADSGGIPVVGMSGSTTQPADPAWIAALTPLQPPTTLTPEQWTAAGFTVNTTAPTVAVNYLVTLSTQVSVDPVTGGTANLTSVIVTLTARPDPAATGGTAAPPQTVFVTTVSETPTSVATDVQLLHSNAGQIRLAQRTLPVVLAAATIVFALLTIALFVRRRRHSGSSLDTSSPPTTPTTG